MHKILGLKIFAQIFLQIFVQIFGKKIFAQIFAEKFAKKLAQIFYGSYLFYVDDLESNYIILKVSR